MRERLADATRRGFRRLVGALHSKRLQIVFHRSSEPPESRIVDQQRAGKIVGHLLAEGWLTSSSVITPRPASTHQLLRVHDMSYLESLDAPEGMARVFGRDDMRHKTAAGYLEAQRWATGGTVIAARRALKLRGRGGVVANLGGGFHHANRDHGHGFCAFNDVAVALASLRAHGFSGRVLVVDLDVHHGDGTRQIFAADDRVLTCSIHATSWNEQPARHNIDVALGLAVGDRQYLQTVEDTVAEAFERAEPELVFYVAGVDVANDDRLGSWRITADGIMQRDRFVLSQAPNVPVVLLTAGGYGPGAWRYTARTLVWLLSGRDEPVRADVERSLERFRHIKDSLEPRALSGMDPFAITVDDVLGDLGEPSAQRRALGYYTRYGIELALARYGLFKHVNGRGYEHVKLELTPNTGIGDRVQLFTDDDEHLLLIELVVKLVRDDPPHAFLHIEWLLMQDPRAQPSDGRPLLPGQEHPGLGCLDLIIGVLVMACERLDLDGVTATPSHYHIAAQARGLMRFLHPDDEAYFAVLGELTKPLPLHHAAALIASGGIVDEATGKSVDWHATKMVLPVSKRMKDELEDRSYEDSVQQAVTALQFRIAD
jgi:acetoin utilization deacetylase AcuC-like enzyme